MISLRVQEASGLWERARAFRPAVAGGKRGKASARSEPLRVSILGLTGEPESNGQDGRLQLVFQVCLQTSHFSFCFSCPVLAGSRGLVL